ncbi:MAG: hypothetical protein QM703_09895 [Gemmatales bacterium]
MSLQPISEKTAEILFNRYLLQSFPLGGVELFAPTSFEEYKNGYDAKFYGTSSFREIYLQFKSPTYSASKARFTISPTTHQHLRLKDYPPRTAFYVAPMITSMAELNAIQASLKSSLDFLKYFICIDANNLPNVVSFLQYEQPTSHRESPRIRYKIPDDGGIRTAQHPIGVEDWLRGNQLQDKFKKGIIGTECNLAACDSFERSGHSGTMGSQKLLNATELLFMKNEQFGDLIRMPNRD